MVQKMQRQLGAPVGQLAPDPASPFDREESHRVREKIEERSRKRRLAATFSFFFVLSFFFALSLSHRLCLRPLARKRKPPLFRPRPRTLTFPTSPPLLLLFVPLFLPPPSSLLHPRRAREKNFSPPDEIRSTPMISRKERRNNQNSVPV